MRRVLTLAALVTVAAVPAAANAAFHFTTPSGNIDCRSFTAGQVSCIVERGSWGIARTRPCPNDWMPRELAIERGRVLRGACRGDIGPLCITGGSRADDCVVLPYGRSVRAGRLRCTSQTVGVTCRLDNGRGRGFRVARAGYRVFA